MNAQKGVIDEQVTVHAPAVPGGWGMNSTTNVTIQIPLVIASKAKQSRHRINGKIQQNRDFTDQIASSLRSSQ